ncbi:hypothetical protein GCM10011415_27280 [Salipiger pallidus]|uniref:Anti-sigma K factor RskA C-terminal domain-containing protein n=1 Tax=Salipiger pallidus TaxID=1775170 RepID=A0A8J3EHA3_9RHOB|nr:anti-sigma factor [Salipiger pallidus]GGG76988.1 hypothetical protein GCM10011415_27280 [Salipiger pallidus]
MSGAEDTDLPGGWDASAAEYVLGLLEGDERAAFEQRLAHDRDLRQDVEAWEDYFCSFTDAIEPVDAPPQVLRRAELELFGRDRNPFWSSLLPYLLGAVAAAAIAWMAMFSGLIGRSDAPHLWADLDTPSRGIELLAHYSPDSGTFMVRWDAGDYPEGRSLEVWMIADADAAPVSIGLVDRGGGLTEIPVSGNLAEQLYGGAAVAISEEAEGGSPSGAPEGPVLSLGSMAPREGQ